MQMGDRREKNRLWAKKKHQKRVQRRILSHVLHFGICYCPLERKVLMPGAKLSESLKTFQMLGDSSCVVRLTTVQRQRQRSFCVHSHVATLNVSCPHLKSLREKEERRRINDAEMMLKVVAREISRKHPTSPTWVRPCVCVCVHGCACA